VLGSPPRWRNSTAIDTPSPMLGTSLGPGAATRIGFLGRAPLIESWLPGNPQSLLEVGCSWGYLIASMGQAARLRVGLDVNRQDLRSGAARYGKVTRFLCSAAETLPFRSEIFDALIMSEVLEHTIDEKKSVAEAARVLKPGGVAVVTVPHRGPMEVTDLTNWKYRFSRLHRVVYGWKHHADYSRFVPVSSYHRHYTVSALLKLLQPQFEVTDVRRTGFLLFALADYAAFLRSPKLARVLFKIAALDYMVGYAWLSYNLAVRLVRTK